MVLKRSTTNLRNWRNRFAAPFGSLSNRPSRKQRFRRLPLHLEILEDRSVPSGMTFTVVNTLDNGGVNPAVGAGTGTLRQAIVDSNANDPGNSRNEIDFQISGSGP